MSESNKRDLEVEDDDSDWVGPLPSEAAPKKKQKGSSNNNNI